MSHLLQTTLLPLVWLSWSASMSICKSKFMEQCNDSGFPVSSRVWCGGSSWVWRLLYQVDLLEHLNTKSKMCASKTSQVLVNYIKKRWQLLHRMTDDKVPITFLIYTKDVHVELDHCAMWCSWHTEEDTTTSDEKMSMVKRHTSLERVQNSLKVEMIQTMRYL